MSEAPTDTAASTTSDTDEEIEGHPMTQETAFQNHLLYTLARLDDPHGLGIKAYLEDVYDQEIHHGRLYPNLDELVDRGLVAKGEKDKRTNSYRLTARGERVVEADLAWNESHAGHLRDQR